MWSQTGSQAVSVVPRARTRAWREVAAGSEVATRETEQKDDPDVFVDGTSEGQNKKITVSAKRQMWGTRRRAEWQIFE